MKNMNDLINKKDETWLRNTFANTVSDYIHEAKSHMDYWSKEDEAECRRQVRDEFILIIEEESRV